MEINDKNRTLSEIAFQHRKSITSLLVDIQGSTEKTQQRALDFIQNLQCLQAPEHPRHSAPEAKVSLQRRSIDASQCSDYVALSWTWQVSRHEVATAGAYRVWGLDTRKVEDSKVRNCVLDRIFRYMQRMNIQLLWIDRHGIVQDTCGDVTCVRHDACVQKRQGMAVMDLVYSYSRHPLGLLGRQITTVREMRLLANLLQGKLTRGKGEHIQLWRKEIDKEIDMTVDMLCQITDDDWWQRGWIFQENYKGGTKMKLLIRHSSNLERVKKRYDKPGTWHIFGNIPGELCLHSVDFFKQATRLCLACRRQISKYHTPTMSKMEKKLTRILRRAGKYTMLLPTTEPMTPHIIADLNMKHITQQWDILPIIANCCGYAIRLDGEELKQKGASLGLCILTQCLLNGEILHNGLAANPSIRNMTATEYLMHARVLLDNKSTTVPQNLTFTKSHRFIDPLLSHSGIQTKGHLWKLHRVIRTETWPAHAGWVDQLEGRLQGFQRKQLAYLAQRLSRYKDLADSICEYLQQDALHVGVRKGELSFAEDYKFAMAERIADSIDRGSSLILGSIWKRNGSHSPYMGVFVWEDEPGVEGGDEEIFAFTASRPEKATSEEYDSNDLDRHVSLEVRVEDEASEIPRLRINRWCPGLCFFRGVPRSDVVFPWPRDLVEISGSVWGGAKESSPVIF